MALREEPYPLARRIVKTIIVTVFLVLLAAFGGILLTHRNTMMVVEPLIRWVRPAASSTEIDRFHIAARKLGHFLVPAAAFTLLVIGPLRRRPLVALTVCVIFAVIDESLQTFMPGRTGSLDDVILDTSGAIFAYFTYRAIVSISGSAQPSSWRPMERPARR